VLICQRISDNISGGEAMENALELFLRKYIEGIVLFVLPIKNI
jgi:hypothetical protein